jgi:hypothetical protein
MRTIQALLGHEYITTTEIYLHVSMSHGLGVSSPLDEEIEFLTNQKSKIKNHQSWVSISKLLKMTKSSRLGRSEKEIIVNKTESSNTSSDSYGWKIY